MQVVNRSRPPGGRYIWAHHHHPGLTDEFAGSAAFNFFGKMIFSCGSRTNCPRGPSRDPGPFRFVESIGFTVAQTRRVFDAAQALGKRNKGGWVVLAVVGVGIDPGVKHARPNMTNQTTRWARDHEKELAYE